MSLDNCISIFKYETFCWRCGDMFKEIRLFVSMIFEVSVLNMRYIILFLKSLLWYNC